jgi:clan AA aspartic protease (TIGR02281 family)
MKEVDFAPARPPGRMIGGVHFFEGAPNWLGDMMMRRRMIKLYAVCAGVAGASAISLTWAQVAPSDPPALSSVPVNTSSTRWVVSPTTQPADSDASAEAVLTGKGLTRVGFNYLLDEDVHLRDGLKDVRQAKAQVDRSTARRAQIEAQIRDADNKMDQLNREFRAVNAQLEQNQTPVRHNQLAARNNLLISALNEGRRFKEQKQKELDTLPNPIDEYVTAVQSLAEKMEAASKRYVELSDDPEVKAALESINAHAPPRMKLGPSAQFADVLPSIRKQLDSVNSAVIKLEIEGGVPHVKVTLNGKVTEAMVVDSGAAIMTLPFSVGKRLGVKLSDGDDVAELVTANGAHVKAHLIRIDTVRLGQFTVKNVEAAILPRGAGGDGLLGGSFLPPFVYRMDLAARELHLSQIGGKPSEMARNQSDTTNDGNSSADDSDPPRTPKHRTRRKSD